MYLNSLPDLHQRSRFFSLKSLPSLYNLSKLGNNRRISEKRFKNYYLMTSPAHERDLKTFYLSSSFPKLPILPPDKRPPFKKKRREKNECKINIRWEQIRGHGGGGDRRLHCLSVSFPRPLLDNSISLPTQPFSFLFPGLFSPFYFSSWKKGGGCLLEEGRCKYLNSGAARLFIKN